MARRSSSELPRADLAPWQRWLRYRLARLVLAIVLRSYLRIRVEGADNLPLGPALLCFNHLGWTDPLILLGTLPGPERLYFYGPREADLRHGARNRLMWWVGLAVPFKPGRRDVIASVRRAEAVFASGARLAIAGEGAIHVHEGDLLPLEEGAAFLALHASVPIVPVGLSGTSALGFGRTVRVRIGAPIPSNDRATHDAILASTWRTWHALRTLVAQDRDRPPAGRFGRWLTELFNDWGAGGRVAAARILGPDPAVAPYGPDGELRQALRVSDGREAGVEERSAVPG